MWSYMMQVKSETILQALNVVYSRVCAEKEQTCCPEAANGNPQLTFCAIRLRAAAFYRQETQYKTILEPNEDILGIHPLLPGQYVSVTVYKSQGLVQTRTLTGSQVWLWFHKTSSDPSW